MLITGGRHDRKLAKHGERHGRRGERLSSIDYHQSIIIDRANYRDNQVHKQNDQLDRINKKAESDKMRVKIANDKAQALLK